MSTEAILKALCALDEAPWGDMYGKPLNARGLARRLREYEVSSKNVREDDQIVKGYTSEDLWDPWQRYLVDASRDVAQPIPPEGIGETAAESVGPPRHESATSATDATATSVDTGMTLGELADCVVCGLQTRVPLRRSTGVPQVSRGRRMTGVHPAARVVDERPTIGAVRVFTVRCPWRHTHTVGLTSTSDAFWCAFGAGFYEVTIA